MLTSYFRLTCIILCSFLTVSYTSSDKALHASKTVYVGEAIHNPNKTLKLYTHGIYSYTGNDCAVLLAKKYGFKLVSRGCIVSRKDVKHNKIVHKKLKKRNGNKWWLKYNNEIKNCYSVSDSLWIQLLYKP